MYPLLASVKGNILIIQFIFLALELYFPIAAGLSLKMVEPLGQSLAATRPLPASPKLSSTTQQQPPSDPIYIEAREGVPKNTCRRGVDSFNTACSISTTVHWFPPVHGIILKKQNFKTDSLQLCKNTIPILKQELLLKHNKTSPESGKKLRMGTLFASLKPETVYESGRRRYNFPPLPNLHYADG